MSKNLTLFSVTGVLVLDATDGSRIFAKYFSPPHHHPHHAMSGVKADGFSQPYASLKDQKAFESGLHEKTAKQTSDIVLFDNHVVVYKQVVDVMMYVLGGLDENEVLLYNVVVALRESLEILLKHSVDKRTLVENFDLLAMAVDEIVDDGIILDTDPVVVSSRVSRPPAHETGARIELNEQGFMNAYQLAKEKLAERIKQGL